MFESFIAVKHLFFVAFFSIFFFQNSFSQCFDCGFNIGGFTEDYINSIVKVSDGIVLNGTTSDGPGKALRKYDFNCNLVWTTDLPFDGIPGTSASLGNIIVGENDAKFSFNFKVENIKILPGSYQVSISKKLLSKFVNEDKNLTYWIALEPDSTYDD